MRGCMRAVSPPAQPTRRPAHPTYVWMNAIVCDRLVTVGRVCLWMPESRASSSEVRVRRRRRARVALARCESSPPEPCAHTHAGRRRRHAVVFVSALSEWPHE